MGSPMVITLGQQYNVGEKPTVILYTYINRLVVTYRRKYYSYSRGPVIATPSGRREKGRYSGRGRYSSIAKNSDLKSLYRIKPTICGE